MRGRVELLGSALGLQDSGRFNEGRNIAAVSDATIRAAVPEPVICRRNVSDVFGGFELFDYGGVRSGKRLGRAGIGFMNQPQMRFQFRAVMKPINAQTVLPMQNATG